MSTAHDQLDLPRETVLKTAHLARLRLTDEEANDFSSELASILAYVDQLKALDVTNVEPMPRPGNLTNRLAKDIPGETLPIEKLFANAPETRDSYFVVPKVLESPDEAGDSDGNEPGESTEGESR